MPKILVVIVIVLASSGRTDAEPTRDWHAGLNLRTELATHPLRFDGGVRLGRLDLVAVVDPLFWIDGQHDVDVFTTWRVSRRGWAVLAGWRTTALGIAGGRVWHQNLLLGLTSPLPTLGPFRGHWGVELSALIVNHGGGLPRSWISFASGRDLGDRLHLAMFVRFEYARLF